LDGCSATEGGIGCHRDVVWKRWTAALDCKLTADADKCPVAREDSGKIATALQEQRCWKGAHYTAAEVGGRDREVNGSNGSFEKRCASQIDHGGSSQIAH
jgi:hypothetical protein